MNDRAKTVSLKDSMCFDLILFFDCEYTCWENSHETLWSDPQHPPELLQIGIAVYNTREKMFLKEFSSLIRPKINPCMSRYCKNLLEIAQEEIDNANEFPIVSNQISEFVGFYTNYSLCICSWGPDYIRISENALRNNVSDPFETVPRMDLVKEALKVFGIKGNHVLRDDIKKRLRLKTIIDRHDAMADAVDLLEIMDALKKRIDKR